MDFWASTGAWKVISAESGMAPDEFLNTRDIDLRYIDGPAYIGDPLEAGFDIWGVQRSIASVTTPFGTEHYSEVASSPLSSIGTPEEIDEYVGWPDPDDFNYAVVKTQAEAVRNQGRVVVFMGDRLNRISQLKPAMYLRGVERILLDVALEPEIAKVIFERITRFYREYLSRILEAAEGLIDIVLTGDDFGQQRGLMMSREMWNDFLAPGFATYIKIIHDSGAKAMHHSCGDVRLLISRMHELGLDILQSLQPESMADAYVGMKHDFGRTLCFEGGISIQQTMPSGDASRIRREVRDRVQVLAPGGGYIFGTAHNIQADCPYGSITALLDAYSEIGRYSG